MVDQAEHHARDLRPGTSLVIIMMVNADVELVICSPERGASESCAQAHTAVVFGAVFVS